MFLTRSTDPAVERLLFQAGRPQCPRVCRRLAARPAFVRLQKPRQYAAARALALGSDILEVLGVSARSAQSGSPAIPNVQMPRKLPVHIPVAASADQSNLGPFVRDESQGYCQPGDGGTALRMKNPVTMPTCALGVLMIERAACSKPPYAKPTMRLISQPTMRLISRRTV
jgi:hypothetical protein